MSGAGATAPAAGLSGVLPSHPEIAAFAACLGADAGELSDHDRVEVIRALEVLKCTAEGAQARVTAEFDASQRARAAAAGVPVERQARGIGAQVALARRESPKRGQTHLSLARVLRDELPHTEAALRTGRITEWRATLIARETGCLALEERLEVDRQLAGDPDRWRRWVNGSWSPALVISLGSWTRRRSLDAVAGPRRTGTPPCGRRRM